MKKRLFVLINIGFYVLLLLQFWKRHTFAQNNPSEIIVVFKNQPTTSLILALSNTSTRELQVKNGITASNSIVYAVEDGDLSSVINEIAKDPSVSAVFPNYKLKPLLVPNDEKATSDLQWNLYKLKLAGTGQTAWDVTTGSGNVVVAVIDTGVQSDHTDLAGKISSLVDCSTGTCKEVSTLTDNDPRGHGTQVAGVIAAATNNNLGVAGAGYNTKLMILRVQDSAGQTTTDSFFNAVKWAADHGAKVINISFGVIAQNLTPAAIAAHNETINYAQQKGAVVVAAAGNCGGNTNGYEACATYSNGDLNNITGYAQNPKLYPAAAPNVIAVSATTTTDVMAGYSEHNDQTSGNWISVAAPGGDGLCSDSTKTCILSTVPTNQYFWENGTSMSAPQVAGVAALVFAKNPSLTNTQVKGIIESTANHNILAGSTYGLVDALAAVNSASNGTTNPTPTGSGNNPTPTLAGSPSVTPAASPTVTPTAGPTATPTITPYPTTAPRLPKSQPSVNLSAPYCPAATGSCTKKSEGDANCDGQIDKTDFEFWWQEFDTMRRVSPPNQNANFACVEGNIQTYFVDLTDFEVWRRNTTSGLVSVIPVVTTGPVGPTVPVPGTEGAPCLSTSSCNAGLCCAQGQGVCRLSGTQGITCLAGTPGTNITPTPTRTQLFNPPSVGSPEGSGGCNGDSECGTGRSCIKGGGGNICLPNESQEVQDRNDPDKGYGGCGSNSNNCPAGQYCEGGACHSPASQPDEGPGPEPDSGNWVEGLGDTLDNY